MGREAPTLGDRFDLDALEEDESTIVHLDREGTILWKNRAWDRFATDNGAPDLADRHGIGTCYFDGVAGTLRAVLRETFDDHLARGAIYEIDYECSSADVLRLFRLRALPLDGAGWLLTHAPLVERPHDREPHLPFDVYRGDDGLVVACSNCRRVRVPKRTAWHWVPAWLRDRPANVSHALCAACEGFYHPRG